MNLLKIFCLASTLLLASPAAAITDIEYLLDLSGSMNQLSDNEKQIDIARRALTVAIQTIPKESYLALRVYGHRIEKDQKEESCKDTELITSLGPLNKGEISNKIHALVPRGYTPIAYSLEQAKNDFSTERKTDKVVILLSDGEETCGGDPVATLEKLKDAGFQAIVHTVGFNVDAKTREQLEAIAQAGGGHYYDAQGAAALTEALKQVTKESLDLEEEKKSHIQQIKGGTSYETAIPLELDIEYRLNHHQKIGFLDYFFIDLKPGKEYTLELKTLEKGINLRGPTPQETDRPYASVQFQDGNRAKIKNLNILGDPHSMSSFSYHVTDATRTYILVGSTYDDMHKDHVTFKVSSITQGDLDSDSDAGDTLTNAMPMEAKRYEKNYIGGGDLMDVFSFGGIKGETYFVGIIPHEDSGSYFRIAIFDSYKQKIMSQNSGINEGLKTKTFTIPEHGTYYLQIDLGTKVSKPASYILELTNIENLTKEKKLKETPKPKKKKTTKRDVTPEPTPKKEPSKPFQIEGPGPLSRPSATPPPKTEQEKSP